MVKANFTVYREGQEHLHRDSMLHREMSVRATAPEAREFTGIGVPYGQTIEVTDFLGRHKESFEPGSVDTQGAKIFWRHGEVIGSVIGAKDTESGLEITGRISDTTQGRDAYALLRDGTIDKLSIGFQPLEWRETDDGEVVYTKVRAAEFSLVPHPAYDQAQISQVRHQAPPLQQEKETPMDMDEETITRSDLEAVTDTVDLLQRKIETMPEPSTPPGPSVAWRSMGEFVKAVASGDQAALDFHREFTGGTTGDTVMKDTFIGDYIKLVADRRRVTNQFTKGTLPATGLSVDYTQLKDDSTQVAQQAQEGDDLPFGKVQLQDANATIETYGGWTELSVQAIERASIPSLNTTFRALALRYARVTEARVRKAYLDLIAANTKSTAEGSSLTLPANAKGDDWLDAIVDASEIFEDQGFSLSGLNVSKDIFKALLRLRDADHRLMTVTPNTAEQVGTLDLRNISANLGNLTVTTIRGKDTNTAAFYDPVAIETLESPGAPVQLQDQNIINLSKQFSLYGYLAVVTPFPQAVLPIKLGGK